MTVRERFAGGGKWLVCVVAHWVKPDSPDGKL